MFLSEFEDETDRFPIVGVAEDDFGWVMPLADGVLSSRGLLWFSLSVQLKICLSSMKYQPPLGTGEQYQVFMSPIEPQISFRIHDDLFFACETFFKQRIPRSKRYSIVSTLDNQVGVGARCLHLLEPGSMMTQKIRPGQGIEGGKDLAGNEGTHIG